MPFYLAPKKNRHTEPFHSLVEPWIISPYRLASLLRDISPHLPLHVATCVRISQRRTQSTLDLGHSTINTNCCRGSGYSIVAFVIVRLFANRTSFIEEITASIVQSRSRSRTFFKVNTLTRQYTSCRTALYYHKVAAVRIDGA